MKVPVNEPVITDEAKALVKEAMDTGWVSSAGPSIEQFEREFAAFIGVKHAITVTNGRPHFTSPSHRTTSVLVTK